MLKNYVGTKRLTAQPMNRGAYNIYRGWPLPANENAIDEGYLVEYLDGGAPNDYPRHAGYISWSPKDVFERSYRAVAPPVEGLRPHEQRVVDELEKLEHKRAMLEAFLQSPTIATLSAKDHLLLREQLMTMTTYGFVLSKRVASFKPAVAVAKAG